MLLIKLCTVSVAKDGNSLTREVVESPSLETLKKTSGHDSEQPALDDGA